MYVWYVCMYVCIYIYKRVYMYIYIYNRTPPPHNPVPITEPAIVNEAVKPSGLLYKPLTLQNPARTFLKFSRLGN